MLEDKDAVGEGSGNNTMQKKKTVVVDSRPSTPDKYFLTQAQIDEYVKRDKIEQKGAQEIRLTNDLYNRVIVVESIAVIIGSFSMALSVMLYE